MKKAINWSLANGQFTLDTPVQYRPWINYISNDEYGIRISHMGDGFSTTLHEPRKIITHYDFFTANKGRYVFIREPDSKTVDSYQIWNPSFFPAKNSESTYRCIHKPGLTQFIGTRNNLEVKSTHGVPLKGCFEIWSIEIKNNSDTVKSFSVFPQVEFLLYDSFSVDPVYYSWYTNSALEADGRTISLFKTDGSSTFGFFSSTVKPNAWESSLSNFTGDGDMARPQLLFQPNLTGTPSAGDPYIGCFQYDITLEPGESWHTDLGIGEGKDNLNDFTSRFNLVSGVVDELRRVNEHWVKALQRKEFQNIRDTQLETYLQTFMPYQIYQQSLGLVRSTFRGYRDVAQDAMGMSYYNLVHSENLIRSLFDKQLTTGRCLRQWHTSGGNNDERDFRDLPFWLILSISKFLDNGGDPSLLSEQAGFLDSNETDSVYEHMVRGLEYALQFGPHNLILMGQGDWNDALSGMGTKGESLWLNQIAYYALILLERINKNFGYSCKLPINDLKEQLFQGVMDGWNGEWFIRGYHENGTIIGGKDDDRIFILPQAWFIISTMAERKPEIGRIAIKTMLKRCNSDQGLLICQPGFTQHDPLVGNLSALSPGMAENFAVYNHASAFGIYALLKAGFIQEAKEIIGKLLPFRKDPHVTKSEPYVLVNYYNGGYYKEKAGHGGIPWLTSTVSWLAMALFDFEGLEL